MHLGSYTVYFKAHPLDFLMGWDEVQVSPSNQISATLQPQSTSKIDNPELLQHQEAHSSRQVLHNRNQISNRLNQLDRIRQESIQRCTVDQSSIGDGVHNSNQTIRTQLSYKCLYSCEIAELRESAEY